MIRWSVYDEGLKIWIDGDLVATIPANEFRYLLAELAQHQKYWNENDAKV
jgi:hypothetical protein